MRYNDFAFNDVFPILKPPSFETFYDLSGLHPLSGHFLFDFHYNHLALFWFICTFSLTKNKPIVHHKTRKITEVPKIIRKPLKAIWYYRSVSVENFYRDYCNLVTTKRRKGCAFLHILSFSFISFYFLYYTLCTSAPDKRVKANICDRNTSWSVITVAVMTTFAVSAIFVIASWCCDVAAFRLTFRVRIWKEYTELRFEGLVRSGSDYCAFLGYLCAVRRWSP